MNLLHFDELFQISHDSVLNYDLTIFKPLCSINIWRTLTNSLNLNGLFKQHMCQTGISTKRTVDTEIYTQIHTRVKTDLYGTVCVVHVCKFTQRAAIHFLKKSAKYS